MFQIISTIVIALLVVIDRVSKILVVSNLKGNGPKPFIPGVMTFEYVENTGAAFSAFSDDTVVLTVFTVLVIILCLIVLYTRKVKSKIGIVSMVLIISGGIGNVIDRIKDGFVVDFFAPDPKFHFAVFNVADIFITVGAFLLIGYEIYELVMEKKNAKAEKENKDD
ncbi:MAG: signal peptidase II [Clostridia bacterium]|nr:signal peptidase II [Clostridia bacterium]